MTLAFRTVKNNYLIRFPERDSIPEHICKEVSELSSTKEQLIVIQRYLTKKYTITSGSLKGQIFPYGENVMTEVDFMMKDEDLKLVFELCY